MHRLFSEIPAYLALAFSAFALLAAGHLVYLFLQDFSVRSALRLGFILLFAVLTALALPITGARAAASSETTQKRGRGKITSPSTSKPWSVAIWALLQAALTAAFTFEHGIALQGLEAFRGESSSYCAPASERRTLSLPDGDNAVLRSGTCISVTYATRHRLIKLESGEAIFTVTHHPDKPFVVDADGISIWDIGTRFDVSTRKELGTRVAVFEGAVSISPHGTTKPQSVPLIAGQELDIPAAAPHVNQITHITPHDAEHMTAWVNGSIQFEDIPLSEALAKFSRHQNFSFTSTDPQILDDRFSGQFNTADVDAFLALLRQQCIDSRYDKTAKTINLSRIVGKPKVGCP